MEKMAAQRKFLQHFYRSRWREQNAAAATDRLKFTQDYTTEIVACADCGLLYRNPRPRADLIAKAYETEHYDGEYLWAELKVQRACAEENHVLSPKIGLGVVPVYSPLVFEDTGCDRPSIWWDGEGGLR